MTELTVAAGIAAPPARVWEVMREFERWPEWTPTMRSVERIGAGPHAVGTKVRIRQPRFPTAVWRFTAIDEGRGFTWVSRAPGLAVTGDHRIEPAQGGSRVTLTLRFEGLFGPLWARLTRGITLRYMNLEAEGLKKRCEARSS